MVFLFLNVISGPYMIQFLQLHRLYLRSRKVQERVKGDIFAITPDSVWNLHWSLKRSYLELKRSYLEFSCSLS